MNRRKVLILIPVAGLLTIALLAVAVRRHGAPTARSSGSVPHRSGTGGALAKAPARPGAPGELAAAADRVRVNHAFRTYWTAVATDRPDLAKRLHKDLGKDRAHIISIAEHERDNAATPEDRETAQKIIAAFQE